MGILNWLKSISNFSGKKTGYVDYNPVKLKNKTKKRNKKKVKMIRRQPGPFQTYEGQILYGNSHQRRVKRRKIKRWYDEVNGIAKQLKYDRRFVYDTGNPYNAKLRDEKND